MKGAFPLDLVVLLSGDDEREAFDELLKTRKESLNIREVKYRLIRHPQRDPGCFKTAPQISSHRLETSAPGGS